MLEEGNEWFYLNLLNIQGADVADGQAIGTIIDDDYEDGQPCPPSLPNCSTPSHRKISEAPQTTFPPAPPCPPPPPPGAPPPHFAIRSCVSA